MDGGSTNSGIDQSFSPVVGGAALDAHAHVGGPRLRGRHLAALGRIGRAQARLLGPEPGVALLVQLLLVLVVLAAGERVRARRALRDREAEQMAELVERI